MAPRPPSRTPDAGFVVAMHARLSAGGSARHAWIIVARWNAGQCLSVGLAGETAAAAAAAPMRLTPQRSLFARGAGAVFHLAAAPPGCLALAGAFLPAAGILRLLRQHPALALRGAGRCLSCRTPWRIDAVQVPWPGAFVEPARP